MPPHKGPMPNVSGDVLSYLADYTQRYPHKNPTVDPNTMGMAAENTFRDTGVRVPTELALSQGQFETDFGSSLAEKYLKMGGNPQKNPFNVGVWDDRIVYHPEDQQAGIQKYYDLMAEDYLKNKTLGDLLSNFVNTSGNRYASDPNYERKVSGQVETVRSRLSSGGSLNDTQSLQQSLKDAGFNPGPIDGKMGPRTRAAVKEFQKANGLVVDGIPGPKTKGRLGL